MDLISGMFLDKTAIGEMVGRMGVTEMENNTDKVGGGGMENIGIVCLILAFWILGVFRLGIEDLDWIYVVLIRAGLYLLCVLVILFVKSRNFSALGIRFVLYFLPILSILFFFVYLINSFCPEVMNGAMKNHVVMGAFYVGFALISGLGSLFGVWGLVMVYRDARYGLKWKIAGWTSVVLISLITLVVVVVPPLQVVM